MASDPGPMPLGATLLPDGRTQFVVWAPHARRVEVLLPGDPERCLWLSPLAGGFFATVVTGAAAGTRYAYSLDGGPMRPDPASHFQPDGVHGPSQVVAAHFDWHDAAWRGRALADYVLYELHVGTFSPTGDFAGVSAALDELVELGVTAIELMPVAQFPGSRNWGYDGACPFAVQNSYGGPFGLKQLVDACHARGLAVVLDVVYNHLGPEGNYLGEFGPYFTARHQTPWGPAVNFEGPGSDEVRRYFIDNAVRWVREFHVDALRLDAIHAIVDSSARPFLAELADDVHQAGAARGFPAWLIAENNRNDPRIFSPASAHGLGLDAQWLDDFGRSLQALLTGERQGFYADFGRLEDLAQAYREGYVLTGQYSHYRGRRHGQPAGGLTPKRFFAYSQTHDQVGNRPQGDRLATLVDYEKQKLAAVAVLLSPYMPLLLMGEEYGEIAPFLYFVSHGDPALIENVRAGRRREFASFDWQAEPVDPQAESTFATSRLNRGLRNSARHGTLWNFYRALLRLRRTNSALRASAARSVYCWPDKGLLTIVREAAADELCVALCFADHPAMASDFELPAGLAWNKVFDSAAPEWLGPGSPAADSLPSAGNLVVGPWSCVVYARLRS